MLKWLIVETIAAITCRIAASMPKPPAKPLTMRLALDAEAVRGPGEEGVEPEAKAHRPRAEVGHRPDRVLDDDEADDEGDRRGEHQRHAARQVPADERHALDPVGDGVEHEPDDERLDHGQDDPRPGVEGEDDDGRR